MNTRGETDERSGRIPDYYEELGLSARSSHDELKRAFRRLLRVLHPDLQTTARARTFAECHTKRLNAMRAVLLNPAARLQYDRNLECAHVLVRVPERVPIPSAPTRTSATWPWYTAALLLASGLVVSLWPPPASNNLPTPQTAPSAAAPRVLKRTPKAKRLLQNQATAPPPSILEFEPIPPMTFQTEMQPPDLPPSTDPHPSPPVSESNASLAGRWLALQPSKSAPGQTYLPEYAQLRIEETAEKLAGIFEARYRVPDRAISAKLTLRFTGSARAAANFKWSAPDGSSGTLSLTQSSPDHMTLTWTADTLGSEMSFSSGSATLVKWNNP